MKLSDLVGPGETTTLRLGGKFGTTIEMRMVIADSECKTTVQMGQFQAGEYVLPGASFGENVGALFERLATQFTEAATEAQEWANKAMEMGR